MAERDFGQVETSVFKSGNQNAAPNNRAILLTVSGVTLAILCLTIGFFMGENYALESNKSEKHQDLISKLQSQQKELETLKAEAKEQQDEKSNTSQVGELTFYNELPEQQVTPEPIQPKPESTFLDDLEKSLADDKRKQEQRPKSIQNSANTQLEDIIAAQMNKPSRMFHIQIASFAAKRDAEAMVQQLLKKDVIAEVQRVDLNTLGIRYRVFSQTFSDEQEAVKTKQRLKDKFNITGLLISK